MKPHKLLKVFRPSNASRQLTCTKSIVYDVNAPYTNSTHAQLGNKLHDIAEEILTCKIEDINDLYLLEDDDIDENVMRMLSQYDEYIASLEDDYNEIMVERKVYLDSIYDFTVSKYGTIDCAIINEDRNTLHIVDLKTGRNDVTAKDNYQLSIYAYVLYQELKNDFNIEYVNLHIFQSLYVNNTNNYNLHYTELEDWIYNNVVKQLDNIRFLDLQYKVGSHCKYCPHLNNCSSVYNEIDVLIKLADVEEIPNFDKVDIISKEVTIIDTLNKYKDDLESELLTGKEIKGVKLVKGNKRNYINDLDMQLLEYEVEQKGLNVDDLYNFKAKTPNQITQMLKDNNVILDIHKYISTNEPKINLALSSNRRKAVKIVKI